MKTQTDNLINDLRRQKPAALGRLFAEHGPTVFRMVQRIVPGREDAEEVYQDVFVKALRAIETFDPKKATLSTWLCRIAFNESLNFVRRRKPNLVYMDDSKLGSDSFEVQEDAPLDEEIIKQLEKALSLLPPHEQAIISMFYYEERNWRKLCRFCRLTNKPSSACSTTKNGAWQTSPT